MVMPSPLLIFCSALIDTFFLTPFDLPPYAPGESRRYSANSSCRYHRYFIPRYSSIHSFT